MYWNAVMLLYFWYCHIPCLYVKQLQFNLKQTSDEELIEIFAILTGKSSKFHSQKLVQQLQSVRKLIRGFCNSVGWLHHCFPLQLQPYLGQKIFTITMTTYTQSINRISRNWHDPNIEFISRETTNLASWNIARGKLKSEQFRVLAFNIFWG